VPSGRSWRVGLDVRAELHDRAKQRHLSRALNLWIYDSVVDSHGIQIGKSSRGVRAWQEESHKGSPEQSPLDFLRSVYTDENLPLHARLKAAAAAAPFVHAKFAVIAPTTTEDLAVRMQQALEARMKVVNARATEVLPPPPKAEPQVVEDQIDEPMAKPFAHDNKSRFRRI